MISENKNDTKAVNLITLYISNENIIKDQKFKGWTVQGNK